MTELELLQGFFSCLLFHRDHTQVTRRHPSARERPFPLVGQPCEASRGSKPLDFHPKQSIDGSLGCGAEQEQPPRQPQHREKMPAPQSQRHAIHLSF